MTIPISEKLIQRQINNWNSLRKFLPAVKSDPPSRQPLVITVSRQSGSGGRQLAEDLARHLGLPLHDRSLVEQVMRQENLAPALVAELDEQVASQSSLWIKGLFNRRIFLMKEYQHALTKTINILAGSIGGVFLGRGANHVLGDRADLRIRLVAGFDRRVENIRDRGTLSQAEARAKLAETDRARGEFITKVYGQVPGRSKSFDLVINTERITRAGCFELAVLALIAQTGNQLENLSQEAAGGN